MLIILAGSIDYKPQQSPLAAQIVPPMDDVTFGNPTQYRILGGSL